MIAFQGMSRLEDVEPLAGLELRVPEDTLRSLEPGRYYEHQLVGCIVETVEGVVLGPVVRVEGGPGGSRLAVDRTGEEVLFHWRSRFASTSTLLQVGFGSRRRKGCWI